MKYVKIFFLVLFVLMAQTEVYAKAIETETVFNKSVDTTTILTADGEKIKVDLTAKGMIFYGYEDKIVLLEAFGYRCPPCLAAISGYNRLLEKYGEKIVIIAVEAWGADKSQFDAIVKQHKVRYRAVSKDHSGKVLAFMQRLTGWNTNIGVPYLMLFSKGGKLFKDVPPQPFPEAHVEKLIETLLQSGSN